jgi:SAM-dependent methyltransferase
MANPAIGYERDMVPHVFGPCAQLLLSRLRPQPGERVLDAACGTGVVARGAARAVGVEGQVVGLDMNPSMLEVAEGVAAEEGVQVEWRLGRFEELPFPDGSFDLALCQHGLQFSPDRPAALGELHRVLRPGGRLGICTWQELERHPYLRSLNEVVERHTGIPALEAPFSLHDAAELRALLGGADFDEVRIEEETILARFPDADDYLSREADTIVAAIPSLQHLDDEAREGLRTTIVAGMAEAAASVREDDHVVFPFHALVVTARRG